MLGRKVGLHRAVEAEPDRERSTHDREEHEQGQDETPAAEDEFFERGDHGSPPVDESGCTRRAAMV